MVMYIPDDDDVIKINNRIALFERSNLYEKNEGSKDN